MKKADIDAIMDRLQLDRDRKKHMDIIKANAEIEAIQRASDAYYDGMYDLAKEIKAVMPIDD